MGDDVKFLKRAIELSKESMEKGGFPAGALIVKDGIILAEGISTGYKTENDPTAHPESAAIRNACKKIGNANLGGAVLYESMQACLMCFSVCSWSGVTKIVYAIKKNDELVDKGYYEGFTDIIEIDNQNINHVEIKQIEELQEEAMHVVREWENRGGFNQ